MRAERLSVAQPLHFFGAGVRVVVGSHGGGGSSSQSSELYSDADALSGSPTDKAHEMKRLVVAIGMGACDTQRTSFLLLGGDAVLLQLLALGNSSARRCWRRQH